jgi:DNA-directed RNA polymerase II subunit RPB11
MIRAYVQPIPLLCVVKLISRQLLLDPSVLFAGYKVPHPLENDIVIKIQTDDRSNPADALKRACAALITQTLDVKQQFMDQAKNIDMGMGPEQAGLGGFDPYGGQTISGAAAAAGPGDDYDF